MPTAAAQLYRVAYCKKTKPYKNKDRHLFVFLSVFVFHEGYYDIVVTSSQLRKYSLVGIMAINVLMTYLLGKNGLSIKTTPLPYNCIVWHIGKKSF
jgi:hypothetical protein